MNDEDFASLKRGMEQAVEIKRAQSPAPDRARALEALKELRDRENRDIHNFRFDAGNFIVEHGDALIAALTHPDEIERLRNRIAEQEVERIKLVWEISEYAGIRADRDETERLKEHINKDKVRYNELQAECERLTRENAGLREALADVPVPSVLNPLGRLIDWHYKHAATIQSCAAGKGGGDGREN